MAQGIEGESPRVGEPLLSQIKDLDIEDKQAIKGFSEKFRDEGINQLHKLIALAFIKQWFLDNSQVFNDLAEHLCAISNRAEDTSSMIKVPISLKANMPFLLSQFVAQFPTDLVYKNFSKDFSGLCVDKALMSRQEYESLILGFESLLKHSGDICEQEILTPPGYCDKFESLAERIDQLKSSPCNNSYNLHQNSTAVDAGAHPHDAIDYTL